jgi:hypothetical protein
VNNFMAGGWIAYNDMLSSVLQTHVNYLVRNVNPSGDDDDLKNLMDNENFREWKKDPKNTFLVAPGLNDEGQDWLDWFANPSKMKNFIDTVSSYATFSGVAVDYEVNYDNTDLLNLIDSFCAYLNEQENVGDKNIVMFSLGAGAFNDRNASTVLRRFDSIIDSYKNISFIVEMQFYGSKTSDEIKNRINEHIDNLDSIGDNTPYYRQHYYFIYQFPYTDIDTIDDIVGYAHDNGLYAVSIWLITNLNTSQLQQFNNAISQSLNL